MKSTITDVRFRKINGTGKLKAIVSIVLDGEIAVHNIKIIQSNDTKLFIAMPNRKDENGVYRDIVHPLTADVRENLENVILTEYRHYLDMAELLDGNNDY